MKALLAGLLLVGIQVQAAEVEKMKEVVSGIDSWGGMSTGYAPKIHIEKLCIEGQLYLVTRNKDYATGITPALAKGVPKQCKNSVRSVPAAPSSN